MRLNQEDPIYRALDPNGKRFMLARELPTGFAPLLDHYGITAVALIPFVFFPHIKSIPVWQMMQEDATKGLYEGKDTIVVPSSGNTAHAVALLAHAHRFRRVKIVLAADVPSSKKEILAALSSVEVIEVGGGKSVAARAREEAGRPGHYLLDQYSHLGNVRAHERYTAPEVWRAAGPKLRLVAAAMGSGGTVCGLGRRFSKQAKRGPSVEVIGARPLPGQQVPGARDERRMQEVTLPWQEVTRQVIEVSRKVSFIAMRELWQAVSPQVGPTSGMAWAALCTYLERKDEHAIRAFAGSTVGFVCPDDGRFYSERTTGELDTDQGLRF